MTLEARHQRAALLSLLCSDLLVVDEQKGVGKMFEMGLPLPCLVCIVVLLLPGTGNEWCKIMWACEPHKYEYWIWSESHSSSKVVFIQSSVAHCETIDSFNIVDIGRFPQQMLNTPSVMRNVYSTVCMIVNNHPRKEGLGSPQPSSQNWYIPRPSPLTSARLAVGVGMTARVAALSFIWLSMLCIGVQQPMPLLHFLRKWTVRVPTIFVCGARAWVQHFGKPAFQAHAAL